MGITSKPQMFETSDGEEFVDEADAKYHEELLSATSAFHDAARRLNLAMALTCKTADGAAFDVRSFCDYWFVSRYHGGGPAIGRVSFGYDTKFELEHWDGVRNSDAAIVVLFERPTSSGGLLRVKYRIRELYHDEKNAKAALLVALKEYIEERRKAAAMLERDLRK